MKTLKLLMLVLILALSGLVQAQGPLLPLAVVSEDKLYVMNAVPRFPEEVASTLTLVSESGSDYRAVWSPDGTKLAYFAGESLMVWDGTQSIEVASGTFAYDIPPGWTRDGLIVYMTGSTTGEVETQVYTVAPQAGASSDLVIDGLPVVAACGIGTRLPMEGALWREGGVLGNRTFLMLTDYGLVYPAECGVTASLYRPFSAETVAFAGGRLKSVALSPDETRLAGLADGSLVLVDLITMAETSPVTTATPQVVAWGRDGSLYYASSSKTRNLLDGLNLNPDQLALLNDEIGDGESLTEIAGFTVQIYRIAPDGTETLLHEQDAYGVGRLAVKETTVVYSTIPNGDAWIQAFLAGNFMYGSPVEGTPDPVAVSVNYLALSESGTVLEAGTIPGNLQHVAVSR